MHDTKNLRWWALGAAALVLALAFVIPHPQANPISIASLVPGTSSTVPPQLLAGDQGPTAPSLTPSPVPTDLAVYVCGSVHRPGVYRFSSGLRVADALTRAGGALADADLEQLNLAERLSDAMKVDVPKKGQIANVALASDSGFAGMSSASSARSPHHRSGRHSGRSSHKLVRGQTLDVNTASEAELTALPGVGPSLARRIVEYRTANGPFQTADDLQNVSGIGPAKFDRLAPYIRL